MVKGLHTPGRKEPLEWPKAGRQREEEEEEDEEDEDDEDDEEGRHLEDCEVGEVEGRGRCNRRCSHRPTAEQRRPHRLRTAWKCTALATKVVAHTRQRQCLTKSKAAPAQLSAAYAPSSPAHSVPAATPLASSTSWTARTIHAPPPGRAGSSEKATNGSGKAVKAQGKAVEAQGAATWGSEVFGGAS